MLEALTPGDVVMVTRIDRFGHQLLDPLAADHVTQATQMPRHLPRPIPRRLQKLLVEQVHARPTA